MEDGYKDRDEVGNASRILANRGRAYTSHRGSRLTVQMFSKQYRTLELIKRVFGGNYYRHQSGWLWSTSRKDTVELIRTHVREFLPTRHNLELLWEDLADAERCADKLACDSERHDNTVPEPASQ